MIHNESQEVVEFAWLSLTITANKTLYALDVTGCPKLIYTTLTRMQDRYKVAATGVETTVKYYT